MTINVLTRLLNSPFNQPKEGIHIFFFLLLNENLSCRYSSEAPHWGISNVNPQPRFWKKQEKYLYFTFYLKKKKKKALSGAIY